MKTLLVRTVMCASISVAFTISTNAQTTRNYTGSDHDWNNPANWTPATVPGAAPGDTVLFDASANTALNGATINPGADRTLGTLIATGSGALPRQSLAFAAGHTLIFDNAGAGALLQLNGGLDLAIASALRLDDNLRLYNASAWGSLLTITGAIDANGRTLTADASSIAGQIVLNGPIAGIGSALVKDGAGILALGGNNTFDGGVTLNNGTLRLASNTALGTGALTLAATGNNKTLATADGATITLANALVFGADASVLTITGGGTLLFNGAHTTGIGATRTINTDLLTTLGFNAGHALTGGALIKDGAGTLLLGSGNNAFTSLTVNNGYLDTASFAGTLTIGTAVAGQNILGTGNITVNGPDTVLNINGAAGSTVDIAGGLITLFDGATVNINNSAISMTGGAIDFGAAAVKGKLNYAGDVTLGDTALLNAAGAAISFSKNVTILNASAIAASGVDFAFTGAGLQTLASQPAASAVAIAGDVRHTGSGTVAVGDIATLALGKTLALDAGLFDLGANATLTAASGITLGGGSLAFGKTAQYAGAITATAASANTTVSHILLRGHDQTLSALTLAPASTATFDLGGSNATSTHLGLGTLTLGADSSLRFRGWFTDGVTTDYINAANALAAADLSKIWFKGYNKGAIQNGSGDITPTPGDFLETQWTNASPDNNWLWGDYRNWLGKDNSIDPFNIPDGPGVKAKIGTLAGATSNKTISLGGGTYTLALLEIDAGGSERLNFANGRLIFDSGIAGVAAEIRQTTGSWFGFNSSLLLELRSDLVFNNIGGGYPAISGGLTGPGDFYKRGGGGTEVRIDNIGFGSYSGNIYNESGWITIYNNNLLGTGTLVMDGGGLRHQYSYNKYTVNNPLEIRQNFTAHYVGFTYNGDVDLGGAAVTRTITASADSTKAGERASVTFGAGLNFTGEAALVKAGSAAMEILGRNSTFSGGLTATGGILYTTLTGNMLLGGTLANSNYLGTGDITSSGASTAIVVTTAGHTTTLQDKTLFLNSGAIRFDGTGALILDTGTLRGSNNDTGTLTVGGDITFGDVVLTGAPNLTLTTTAATSIRSTGATPAIAGLRTVEKTGSGDTTIDTSVTSLTASTITVSGGRLILGANDQIGDTSVLRLNGGVFDTAGHTDIISQLQLAANSGILLGSTGGLTFDTFATGATWNLASQLNIQNDGDTAKWLSNATYLRLTGNQTLDGAHLATIAFTGYETGATTSYDGTHTYLRPTGAPTNEWLGAGANDLWGNPANWLGAVPQNAGDSATIRDLDTNLDNKSITVDAAYSLARLNIESSAGQKYAITGNGGPGSLTFDTGTPGTNARLRHAGGNTVTLSAPVTLASDLDLHTLVAPANGYLDWTGPISGPGAINKIGAGTLRISANNTFGGGFDWRDASVIQLAGNGSLLGLGDLRIGAPGQTQTFEAYAATPVTNLVRTLSTPFTLAGNLTISKQTENDVAIANPLGHGVKVLMTGDGVIETGAHTLHTWANAASFSSYTESVNLELSGRLTGGGSLIKTGMGQLTFSGVGNDFSGGVTLDLGTINVATDDALGTGLLKTDGVVNTVHLNATAPTVTLGNAVSLNGGAMFYGNFIFDHDSTASGALQSTINGTFQFGQESGKLVVFGTNHALTGSGVLQKGARGSYGSGGTIRMLGANTFSGGLRLQDGTLQVGVDSIMNSGTVASGALGTGRFYWDGGNLAAYSDAGSNITTRRVSNAVTLAYSTIAASVAGDAKKLIIDTDTDIALRNGTTDLTINVASGTLAFESRLTDASAYAGGITKTGAGTLELSNPGNQITAGIVNTAGIIRAAKYTYDADGKTILSLATGNVTIGAAVAGENYFGTGALYADGAASAYEVDATPAGIVTLLGRADSIATLTLNNNATFRVIGAPAALTRLDGAWLDSTAGARGLLSTTGTLAIVNNTSRVGVRLSTPDLSLQGGALAFTAGQLLAATNRMTLDGGTLDLNGTRQILGGAAFTAATGTLHVATTGTVNFTGASAWFAVNTLSLADASSLVIQYWNGNPTSGMGVDRFILKDDNSVIGALETVQFTGGFGAGAKVIRNADGQYVLIPQGVAFIWTGSKGANWNPADTNWKQPYYDEPTDTWGFTYHGIPRLPNDAATFADDDLLLNGKTITIAGNIAVGSLSFESTQGQRFTIDGALLTMQRSGSTALITVTGNSSPTIASDIYLPYALGNTNNLLINHAGSGTLTLSGQIDGAGNALVKNGDGHLALDSADSLYAGGLIINAGTVTTAASSNLSGGAIDRGPFGLASITINDDATLGFTRAGAQTIHNDIDIATAKILTLSAVAANDTTYAGRISGDASIDKTGSGLITLSTTQAYTGTTTVSTGTLQLGDADAIISSTGVNVNAHLVTGPNQQTLNNLAGATTGVIHATTRAILDSTLDTTYAGTITDAGSIVKSGSATLTLAGANTHTGTTIIHEGTLIAAATGPAGPAAALSTGPVHYDNIRGSTLHFLTTATMPQRQIVDTGASGTLSITPGNILTLTSTVTNANSGGAVHVADKATFTTLGDMRLAGNTSTYYGGAIYGGTGATINITGSTAFENNTAAGFGGAIHLAPRATLNIDAGATFINNRTIVSAGYADITGGAIMGDNFTDINFNDTSANIHFAHNGSGRDGGAVFSNADVTFRGGATFVSNTAGLNPNWAAAHTAGGGAIGVVGNNLVIGTAIGGPDTLFENNYAFGNGGAIYFTGTNLTLNANAADIIFRNNTEYKTVADGERANAIYLRNNNGNARLTLNTDASRTIRFLDPIKNKTNHAGADLPYNYITVDKNGAGDLLFDASLHTDRADRWSQIYGVTNINAGALILANNAEYGLTKTLAANGNTTDSIVNLTASSTLRSAGTGTNQLHADRINVASGALVLIEGNTLLLDSGSAAFANSSTIAGSGTLDATAGLALVSGTVHATVAASGQLSIITAMRGSGALGKNGSGTLVLTASSNYTGGTNIDAGTLIITHINALGTGTADIGAASELRVATTGATTFVNSLKGDGLLNVALDSTASTFSLSALQSFSLFTGTLQLTRATYSLAPDTPNEAALAAATLRTTAGSILNLGANTVSGSMKIHSLELAGGLMNVRMRAPDAAHVLEVDTLRVIDADTATINLDSASLAPGSRIAGNFLSQDTGTNGMLLVKATGASPLDVEKQIALLINGTTTGLSGTTYTVADGFGNSDVEATYSYAAHASGNDGAYSSNTPAAGIYVDYLLTQLKTNSNLVLDNTGATDTTLSALVTGTGNLTIQAHAGAITLSHSNSYSGTTFIDSGTLIAGAHDALGQTAYLLITNSAAFNLNTRHQTIVNGGTIAGHLAGSGSLGLGGFFTIDTANTALTANVGVTGTTLLRNTDAIGRTGTATISSTAALHLNASGTFVKTLAGSGQVNLLAASTVAVLGMNSTYTGTFTIAPTARLIAETTANLGHATDGGNLSGSGVFEKQNTTTTLTISHANPGFSGSTLITGGTLAITAENALGSGAIMASAPSGTSALLASYTGALDNNIGGAGTAILGTGASIAITGSNTIAAWQILGSGTVTQRQNLGSGSTRIDGRLSILSTGSWTYANALTGDGRLIADTNHTAFNFDSNAGTAFAGTAELHNLSFNLSGQNTAALTHATLQIDTGASVVTGSGIQNIGNLTLQSGTLAITLASTGTSVEGLVRTGTLNVQDTILVIDTGKLADNAIPLLQQDEGKSIKLIESTTLAAASKTLITGTNLVDHLGNEITDATHQDINQDSQHVANATYDYAGLVSDTGIDLTYALTELELLAGKTTTLTGDIDDAILAGADDLKALVSGTGSLRITATSSITLRHTNTYTGTTFVTSGTLIAGADNALGQTARLNIDAPAAFDLNGKAQTIRDGGQIDGHLFGTGTLILSGGTLAITSANAGYAALTHITAPATAHLTDAAGLGTAHIQLDGLLHISNTAAGTFEATFAGTGTLIKDAATTLTLRTSNTAFHGSATVNQGRLTATQIDSLGTAPIAVATGATFEQLGVTGTLQNTLSGAGTHAITSSAIAIADAARYTIANTTLNEPAIVLLAADNIRFGALQMNKGTLIFSNPLDRAVIDTLGDTTGNFLMNVRLAQAIEGINTAGTVANHLAIGFSGSGTHNILINPLTEPPSVSSLAIELITTGSGGATFLMANPGGKIEYGLVALELLQGDGSQYLPDPHAWYLADNGASHAADAIINTASSLALDWANNLDALHLRMGELRASYLPGTPGPSPASSGNSKPAGNLWLRSRGYRLNATNQVTGMGFHQYGWSVTGGADISFATERGINLIGGLIDMGGVDREFDNHGTGDTHNIGIGAYLTHLARAGWYADFVARVDRYHSRFDAHAFDGRVTSARYNTHGASMNLEAGRRFQRADGWWFEPALQAAVLWLGSSGYDTTSADSGQHLHVEVAGSMTTQYRALVRFGRQFRDSNWQPYGKFAAAAVDNRGGEIRVLDRVYEADFDGKRIEFGLGVMYRLNDISQIYADYEYAKATAYERPWTLNLGYRRLW